MCLMGAPASWYRRVLAMASTSSKTSWVRASERGQVTLGTVGRTRLPPSSKATTPSTSRNKNCSRIASLCSRAQASSMSSTTTQETSKVSATTRVTGATLSSPSRWASSFPTGIETLLQYHTDHDASLKIKVCVEPQISSDMHKLADLSQNNYLTCLSIIIPTFVFDYLIEIEPPLLIGFWLTTLIKIAPLQAP